MTRDTERPDPGLSLTPHLLTPCPVPFALLPLSSQREPAVQQSTFLLLMQLGPQLCIPQQSRGHPTLNHGLFVTPLFSFCAPHHSWIMPVVCRAWVPWPVGAPKESHRSKGISYKAAQAACNRMKASKAVQHYLGKPSAPENTV